MPLQPIRYFIALTFFFFFSNSNAQTWSSIGPAYGGTSPYPLYYYKVCMVNAATDRYASIIEFSCQGDANFFDQQGTFQVRVDKWEGTTSGRFDGMEIRCLSGNPAAISFYVFNNELWIRSNFLWGGLYYREVARFLASPLVATFTPTATAPTGYLFATNSYGLKCDFDNNIAYSLPYTQPNGITSFGNSLLLNSQITNADGRPAVAAGNIPSEIRGVSKAAPTADDGLLRLSAGGGSNANTKSYIDLSGHTAYATNDRYRNIVMGTSGVERLRIDANGNVGIGTLNAQGYKLAVKGTGAFTKIIVKSTEGWPDYVFDSSYRLPSLNQVDSFIRNNKHLPGIPSAAAVTKDGVDIGDNQALLLKKIEELTLYIIELNKKVETQQQSIQAMEQQLSTNKN